MVRIDADRPARQATSPVVQSRHVLPTDRASGSQSPAEPLLRLQHSVGNRAVQRLVDQARASSSQRLTLDPATVAQDGVTGPGTPLPHLERLQSAFGRHDVRGVRVHTGPRARSAADLLSALAFTTGSHIALGGPADLALAAHEAAHVVQQRNGARPPGGMGTPGDHYERQADAVAAAVVAGRSAEPLLDAPLATSGTADGAAAVQLTPLTVRVPGRGRSTHPQKVEIADITVQQLLTVTDVPEKGGVRDELRKRLEDFSNAELDKVVNGPRSMSDVVRSAAWSLRALPDRPDRPGVGGPWGTAPSFSVPGAMEVASSLAASGPVGNPLTLANSVNFAKTELTTWEHRHLLGQEVPQNLQADIDKLELVAPSLGIVGLVGDSAAAFLAAQTFVNCAQTLLGNTATVGQRSRAEEDMVRSLLAFNQALSGGASNLLTATGQAGLAPIVGLGAQILQLFKLLHELGGILQLRAGLTRFRKRYDDGPGPEKQEGEEGLGIQTRLRLVLVVHTEALWRTNEKLGWNLSTLGNTLVSIASGIASLITGGVAAPAMFATGLISLAIPAARGIIDAFRDIEVNGQARVEYLAGVMKLYPDLVHDVRHLITDVGLDPSEILSGDTFTSQGKVLLRLRLTS